MNLEIRYLREGVTPPWRAHPDDAALDISACLLTESGRELTTVISPRTTKNIPTGIALRPPPGFVILVCSRSGLAGNSLFVANSPGVVDPGYTGEIRVLLYNGGLEPYYLKHGDRIGQILLTHFHTFPLRTVESFPITERGEQGFGSTGR